MIDSIVTTVDVYDLIVVKSRKDSLVSVTMHGMGSEAIQFENNNAARAAELFCKRFSTNGADVTVYKNIPMGAGLGGSSADAAGVLNALADLYKITDLAALGEIADLTGSDTRYMLTGGYARLTGRGNAVRRIKSGLKAHFLLALPNSPVSTAECYALYDKLNLKSATDNNAEIALVENDFSTLAKNVNNALFAPATSLNCAVKEAYDSLAALNPPAVNMTGSGSGVYAMFENAEFADYAVSRYRGRAKIYRLKTVSPKIKGEKKEI